MAIALVGVKGALKTVAAASIQPAFGQATTAGNLLVAFIRASSNSGTNTISSTSSGWVKAVDQIGQTIPTSSVAIWYKPNCGATETAPTFTGAGGAPNTMSAELAEYSGAQTAPLDKTKAANGFSSPLAVTASAVDSASGDLQATAFLWGHNSPATSTTTDTYGANATAINLGNDDSTVDYVHFRFSYAVTTGIGNADTDSGTTSAGALQEGLAVLASFRALVAGTIIPASAALTLTPYMPTATGFALNVTTAGASVSSVQLPASAASSANTLRLPLTTASTAGTTLIAIIANTSGDTITSVFQDFSRGPSQSLGHRLGISDQAGAAHLEIWSIPNNPGGIVAWRFGTTSGLTQWVGEVSEWNGLASVVAGSPLTFLYLATSVDASGAATATAGTTLVPVTTTNVTATGELAISAWCQKIASGAVTFTTPAGFTRLIDNGVSTTLPHFDAEYKTNPGTGATLGPTLTSTGTTTSAAGLIVTIFGVSSLTDQTSKLEYGSLNAKRNTFDFSLLDPTTVPNIGDTVKMTTPPWSGTIASIELADIVNLVNAHKRVTIAATNQAALATGSALFGLSDAPNGSTTFGYSGLRVKTTQNTDGSYTTYGSLRTFQQGLVAGQTFNLTSTNLGYSSTLFAVTNVTQNWVGLTPVTGSGTVECTVEFGDAILTSQTAGSGLTGQGVLTGTGAPVAPTVATTYRARAHPSVVTSVTLAAVQITLGTVDFDPNANFAANQYTVPVTGYYLVNGSISIGSATDLLTAIALIYKNNAVIATGAASQANGTFGPHAMVMTQQHFVAGDTIQLYGECTTTTNNQVASDATFLEISFMGT